MCYPYILVKFTCLLCILVMNAEGLTLNVLIFIDSLYE